MYHRSLVRIERVKSVTLLYFVVLQIEWSMPVTSKTSVGKIYAHLEKQVIGTVFLHSNPHFNPNILYSECCLISSELIHLLTCCKSTSDLAFAFVFPNT